MDGAFQNYDRVVELQIPAGEYVYFGYAAKQTDYYRGGGLQIWLPDEVIDDASLFDWNSIETAAEVLPAQ